MYLVNLVTRTPSNFCHTIVKTVVNNRSTIQSERRGAFYFLNLTLQRFQSGPRFSTKELKVHRINFIIIIIVDFPLE